MQTLLKMFEKQRADNDRNQVCKYILLFNTVFTYDKDWKMVGKASIDSESQKEVPMSLRTRILNLTYYSVLNCYAREHRI